jgi:predicted peptidase
MKCLLSLVVAGVLFLVPGTTRAADSINTGQQKPAEFDRTTKVKLKCLIYLPKDYDQKDSWPVLLFLHGIGERGDNLDLVKKHGPPKLIAGGKQFPFIIVSPQCPNGQWWEPTELVTLLDEIAKKYKVDQDRICLTGLSMGGFGTWALAAYQPNRFAAIVPICGGGDPSKAKRIAHIPAWVFHGGKDRTVPIENSKKMVEALKKDGGNPKLTIYPEAGHDSWTQAYNDPKLYEWLLQQKRTTKKPEDAKK